MQFACCAYLLHWHMCVLSKQRHIIAPGARGRVMAVATSRSISGTTTDLPNSPCHVQVLQVQTAAVPMACALTIALRRVGAALKLQETI
jgi:hypothetical protein